MLSEMTKELVKLERESKSSSEVIKALYNGKVQGYKLGLALLEKFCSEQSFICWGAKILTVKTETTKKYNKLRVKTTIQHLINNNQNVIKNQVSVITPYLQGHILGLEAVMSYL